jgi:hypothetical protein
MGTETTGQLGRHCQTARASSSPSVITIDLPPPKRCWPKRVPGRVPVTG